MAFLSSSHRYGLKKAYGKRLATVSDAEELEK